ncbi:MAG: hypothetical protein ACK40K_05620 [Raineya sp.]
MQYFKLNVSYRVPGNEFIYNTVLSPLVVERTSASFSNQSQNAKEIAEYW